LLDANILSEGRTEAKAPELLDQKLEWRENAGLPGPTKLNIGFDPVGLALQSRRPIQKHLSE
jgi:hypothetical protein